MRFVELNLIKVNYSHAMYLRPVAILTKNQLHDNKLSNYESL